MPSKESRYTILKLKEQMVKMEINLNMLNHKLDVIVNEKDFNQNKFSNDLEINTNFISEETKIIFSQNNITHLIDLHKLSISKLIHNSKLNNKQAKALLNDISKCFIRHS